MHALGPDFWKPSCMCLALPEDVNMGCMNRPSDKRSRGAVLCKEAVSESDQFGVSKRPWNPIPFWKQATIWANAWNRNSMP